MGRRKFRLMCRGCVVAATMTSSVSVLVGDSLGLQEATASEIMQSVFGNRLRDGGQWRQDNPTFEVGSDAPTHWAQVWRSGPGNEVVIVDAYGVSADGVCSSLMHIVYTYDRESERIRSSAFGAKGVSGHGVTEFARSVTTSEITIQLPNGGELRMRDHQDHGSGDAVVVESERWEGEEWRPGDRVTWRRATNGTECGAA